jgi:uncharacterized protein (DUF608 family)
MKAVCVFFLGCSFCLAVSAQHPGHPFNGPYSRHNLSQIAFPIGGMGAGMFCLEGTGALSHMSVRNHPDMFNEPVVFSALYVKGAGARVLEGPVADWKKFGRAGSAMGAVGATYGLARFSTASFVARFPFGRVKLTHPDLPVKVVITGWSPFIPGDADNSSLPVGALEYQLTNTSTRIQSGVLSYNAENFMTMDGAPGRIKAAENGFILSQEGTEKNPELRGDFAIFTDDKTATVDACWFRGGWWDPLTMAWKKIQAGDTKAEAPVDKDAPGASLYVPFTLEPGEHKAIRILMAWYVPYSHVRYGVRSNKVTDTTATPTDKAQPSPYFMPWYSSKFKNIGEVITYWKEHYNSLKQHTKLFTDAFYSSTLPSEVLEAVAANLTILKSPTVLRQYDGRFWGWEGCNDNEGSCAGNCTHVYTYAQALCHLFPAMQRSIDETELGEGMDADGHQNYREAMPIRPEGHQLFLPAADGQLGGIMKVYREWRISGDDAWLKAIYPKVKTSLDYCIQTWDPDHNGTLTEPHHNTYDIEFWGADGMGTSIYLGALEAFIEMTDHLNTVVHNDTTGDIVRIDQAVVPYMDLFIRGRKAMETQLYNGEYFIQHIQWKGLHNDPNVYRNTAEKYAPRSPEAQTLLDTEGPEYQYGKGCLSDGVIGCWMAWVCGLPEPIDTARVKSHLESVYRYNFKTDLSSFSNPQRSTYALGNEGGLLLCTWPKGGALSLPFVYSNEVWTGIEYEVASHLIHEGQVKEGLAMVRATRKRYDGTVRNPFDEYECGHWYMRAMSSYALLEALTGVRYDAVEETLYVDSKIGDFTGFLSTNTGFGNVIYKNGKVTLAIVYGDIDVKKIKINRI